MQEYLFLLILITGKQEKAFMLQQLGSPNMQPLATNELVLSQVFWRPPLWYSLKGGRVFLLQVSILQQFGKKSNLQWWSHVCTAFSKLRDEIWLNVRGWECFNTHWCIIQNAHRSIYSLEDWSQGKRNILGNYSGHKAHEGWIWLSCPLGLAWLSKAQMIKSPPVMEWPESSADLVRTEAACYSSCRRRQNTIVICDATNCQNEAAPVGAPLGSTTHSSLSPHE